MASVIQDYKKSFSKFKDLSLNNQYQVYLSGISGVLGKYIAKNFGVSTNWINNDIGILCSEATLPTSSFATSEVKDNYQGINQQFAHTKLFVDSDFTFYVDKEYNMIKFFEGWMSYISGDTFGSNPEDYYESEKYYHSHQYTRRFNYPSQYKIDTLSITKFERQPQQPEIGPPSPTNHSKTLTYKFINAFPKMMTAIPVQYGNADILKVVVSFAYDRYVLDRTKWQLNNQN
jgi:hypothetical protein